jgi:hypothetical protein
MSLEKQGWTVLSSSCGRCTDQRRTGVDTLKEVVMTDVNDRFQRFFLSPLSPSASKKMER